MPSRPKTRATTKSKAPASKAAPRKTSGMATAKSRPPLRPGRDGVVRLAGGNPQIAKADGAAPVQAYIEACPGWQRDVARRLDLVITKAAPGARKAVKWNSPFYGMPGQGWFVSFHVFAKAVKVTFFRGKALAPPVTGGTSTDAGWLDVHDDDLDERQMAAWVKQAVSLPGWGSS